MIETFNNTFWNNSGGDFSGYGTWYQYDDISADPELLDTTSPYPIAWDLHLNTNSPLIDAGDSDINDPDGSLSDIGLYGGPEAATRDRDQDGYPEWWLPGAYDPATSPGMDCDDRDPAVYPTNGC